MIKRKCICFQWITVLAQGNSWHDRTARTEEKMVGEDRKKNEQQISAP